MAHVLAVEDSRTQAEALRAVLESAGFEVTLARDGSDALRRLDAGSFDLIVSDVVMPEMDGYELCRTVKANPATRDVPVILLTSLTDPLDVVSGLESGADNFLRKPYLADQLIARLRAALRNRELRSTGEPDQGIRLAFLEREFEINADRTQMLDLLVSTFEEVVATSRQVRAREEELITAHAALQGHLQTVDLERKRLKAVVASTPVPLFVVNSDGLVSQASEATARAFGTTADQMHGRHLDDVVTFVDAEGTPIAQSSLPHHRAQTKGEASSIGAAFDVFLLGEDGDRLPVLLEASPIFDDRGQSAGCVGTAHVLGALTQHDPMTGLPNSVAYLERVARLLADPRGDAALLLLELDRFDAVRAVNGNAAANTVLVEVARLLGQVFEPTRGTVSRSECFLAYLGGNQFGVVLANLPDSFSLLHMAESARRAVAGEYADSPSLRVTASIGIALGDAEHDAPQLFAAANLALRRAREGGGDHVELFGHDASQKALARLQLEADLRAAVDAGEIEVHYQPEVELVGGQLIGFEALARWRHASLGPIAPDVFVTLAEESGVILPLGRHVLTLACEQAGRWSAVPGAEPLTVAVNVSTLQLVPGFVTEVLEILDGTGLDPGRLMLEVTETAAMSDPDAIFPVLERLRAHGVGVSLDDFGTGYSSLALLTRLQFDQLKLDRSFVAGMESSGRDAIVARSVVALGEALGLPVLAEGIETTRQVDALRELGCSYGQGYLLGRPMDASALATFLDGVRHDGSRPDGDASALTHRG